MAPPRNTRWRVSAGYIYRSFEGVNFRTGSRSQHSIPRAPFGKNKTLLPPVGNSNFADDRYYDNGRLLIDSSGAAGGLTWNWGYEDASQLGGGRLAFRNSGGSAREVTSSQTYEPYSWSDSPESGGPYLQLDYQIDLDETVSAGPLLGFSYFNIDSSQNSSTFRARETLTEYRVTVDDSVDLGGLIAPLAPFEGSFGGPGPLVPIVPDRRVSRSQTNFGSLEYFNEINESFEADLFTFSPGVGIQLSHENLFVNLAAGLAVNVVDWEAQHDERLFVSNNGGKAREQRRWRAHEGGTDVLVGAFVQAGVGVELTEHVSVSGFVRYDWSQDLAVSVGPSRFDVDLSGVTGGVMATISF